MTAPAPVEIPDETQNLIGDLEYLAEISERFFVELYPLIRKIKRHSYFAQWAEKPARAAFEVASDFAVDGLLEAILADRNAKEDIDRSGFDLAGALRKAARSAANQ